MVHLIGSTQFPLSLVPCLLGECPSPACLIDLIPDFMTLLLAYIFEKIQNLCSSSAYIKCRRREERYFCQPWTKGLASVLELLSICNLWYCIKCPCLQVENKFPLLIPISNQLILNGMDSSECFSSLLFSSFLCCTDLHGSFSLTLTIGNDFLPDIKLLVYTVFLDGQVVADVEEFQVAKCFRHKVSRNAKWKKKTITSLISSGLLSFLVLFYL